MALDFRLYDEDAAIDLVQWADRHRAKIGVGSCAVCRGVLVIVGDSPWETIGRVRWLTAQCVDCAHEVTSPNGRVAGTRVPVEV